MRYAFIFTILIFIFASCNKDKYTTAPQLKYKSANTKNLQKNEVLTMTLEFTDAEGDLTDTVYIQQFAINCSKTTRADSFKLPAFPTSKNSKGELLVTYANSATTPFKPLVTPQCGKNDTCIFKFVIRDKEKHRSDTAYSDPIIIYL